MERTIKHLSTKENSETVFSWLWSIGVLGVKSLPKMTKQLVVQIGIVVAFQVVFWYEGIAQFIPDIIKGPVIFLTATYNDVIPKTIYWVIVFTFGKKLLSKIKSVGLARTLEPLKGLIPTMKLAMLDAKEKANYYLLLGAGIGLITQKVDQQY